MPLSHDDTAPCDAVRLFSALPLCLWIVFGRTDTWSLRLSLLLLRLRLLLRLLLLVSAQAKVEEG